MALKMSTEPGSDVLDEEDYVLPAGFRLPAFEPASPERPAQRQQDDARKLFLIQMPATS